MNRDVIVIGASGHAKVVIELFRATGVDVAYCIGTENCGEFCLGVPVLVGDLHISKLFEAGFTRAFIAVGSNQLRERLAQLVQAVGFKLVCAISPDAVISPTAKIGIGVAIMAGVVINAECDIADLAIINTGATVDHDCVIGRVAHIAPQCALAGNVWVGERAFLGIGSRVIPGIRIGVEATIGAGGVVIADVADHAVAVGIPAVSIR